MQTIDDYTRHFAEQPTGVHPSLVHRLARPLSDELIEELRSRETGIPAALRGPTYEEN